MEIEEIFESQKKFTLRFRDNMGDYEDVEVEMCSAYADPKSKHFTHSEVKINSLKNRTIDEHVAYLQTVCTALKVLKNQLIEGNK